MNLDVSSKEGTFVIPASCCKANLTEEVCKRETRRKVGETRFDESSSIYPKVMKKESPHTTTHTLVFNAKWQFVCVQCTLIFYLRNVHGRYTANMHRSTTQLNESYCFLIGRIIYDNFKTKLFV